MIDAQERLRRRAMAAVLVAFGFLSLDFTGAFPPFSNPNELSRLESVVAAVDDGTLAIDSAIARLGDHEDKSSSDGRTYSNKAPGLALAAVPIYRLLRFALDAPATPGADPIVFWLRFLTVTAVCLVALARFGRRVALWADPAAAPLVLAAAALGTVYLFYGRSFFGHAWSAALLFLAWDLLTASEGAASPRRAAALLAGAGLLAGWAAISEYTTAPVAGLLALRAFAGATALHRRVRAAVLFAAGLAVPLIVLALYNRACFGSPWVLSSAREAYPQYRELAGRGLFGFGPPSLGIAVRSLLSPERGVLVFSPVLLFAIPGFYRWHRSGRRRPDFWLAICATVVFFVLMTGYPNWHGGWSLGSRYLLPILFFPMMAAGFALATPVARGLFVAALVFSVASHFILTASFPYFPDNVPWPLATGSGWFLSRLWVAPAHLAGGGLALLLPAIVTAAALALAIRASGPSVPRPAVAVLLGFAPVVFLLLRPPEISYGARLWRAAIFGAYSGVDPGREELKAVVLEAATPEERRQALGAWRVYGVPASPPAP
jgi:hypothetical protein